MTMHYYINPNDGTYLGGWDDGTTPPAGAVEVPGPPDLAQQVWTGTAWYPPVAANPNPIGLITDIAYDIVLDNGPWQMVQFFYALQMQGTATNLEIDYLRKALWAKLKTDTSITSTWLTSAYITKMETWAANRNMPLV